MKNETIVAQLNIINENIKNFINSRKIIKEDVKKAFEPIDSLIYKEQIRVISDSRLTPKVQSTIFGALRTLNNSLSSMKISLLLAFERGENPTTAEKCEEIMPNIFDVTKSIRSFNPYIKNSESQINYIFNSSRSLHKKAKIMGFEKNIEDEIKELKLDPSKVNEFVDMMNNNLED